MHVEVDQSGRIDQTNWPTVLALANGMRYSILVPAKVKQKCLRILRRRWGSRDPDSLYVYLFATLLYLLLREKIAKLSHVTIDIELPKHEPEIKGHVINLLRNDGVRVDREKLSFSRITKKSPAHKLAYAIYGGFVEPDEVIGAEDVLAKFRK